MKTGREINRFGIQIIAYVTMFVDHFAVILLYPLLTGSALQDASIPEPISYSILRKIGRLSFPLFAFMISEGVAYTKNGIKYFVRLLLLSLASIIPYGLAFQTYGVNHICSNVLFTLSIGALMLLLVKHIEEKFTCRKELSRLLQGIIILLSATAAQLIHADYGLYGVILILLFYICRRNRNRIFPVCGLWMVGGCCLYYIALILQEYSFAEFKSWGVNVFGQICAESVLANCCAIFSLFIIYFYNGKEGTKIPRVVTYLFYPVHLILLWVVAKAIL